MIDQTAIFNALHARLPFMSDRDRDFAASLLSGFQRYGSFSAKQLPHAQRLSQPEAPQATFDVSELFGMFNLAQSKLKRPTIRVRTDNGLTYTIRPAGAQSANHGSLYLFVGERQYAGCLKPTGEFRCSREVKDQQAQIETAIGEFAADPAKAAKAYGTLTGSCCFCGRGLDDAASVELGYGPVCAKRYGLPHTPAKKAKAATMTADGAVQSDWVSDEVPF